MKSILKNLFCVSTLALTAMQPAAAVDLNLANFMSPNHAYEKGVFQKFADDVSNKTNGDVHVSIFSGGELGAGPVQQYDRVVDGVADLVFALPGYTAANFPVTLLTELPGLIPEATGTELLLANKDLLAKEYRRVKLVGIWTNAQNAIYTSKKPVRSLADMKGLKIRVPSRNAGLVIESWGATPVSMPSTEIYNAMQTGVIDGAFIDGTATDSFRLAEVTQYITTGMNSSISVFAMLMNRDSFKDLSKSQQEAVLEAGQQASVAANQIQLANAYKGLENFSTLPDKEWIQLSDEQALAFNEASVTVIQRLLDEQKNVDADRFVTALQGH